MNELSIPKLINSGRNSKFLKRCFILLLLFALFLHISLFIILGYYNKHPFLFFFKDKAQPITEKTLNFVLVDDKLVNEEIKEEKPKVLGKVSRQSRDQTVNKDLPKFGPNSEEKSSVSAFARGNPLPDSVAAPEITPSPPPVPQIKPQKETPPAPLQKPVIQKPQEQPAREQVLPKLPELDIDDDLTGILPKPQKVEKPKPVKKPDIKEVPGITKSDAISKITPQPQPKTEPVVKPVTTPQAKPAKTVQKKIPTRKIPVRRISSSNSRTGGKLQNRKNSSAINTGMKSIAVLRSRYGDYMDKILRRIQQSIVIQQQINPIGMHEGSVVMSFTINPQGYLDQIKFIGAAPDDITTEISVSRTVLRDVQNSGPFEPPTQEMLNDPDFQKIVVNFVFENL